jgi:Tripartite tricarboxylate transporter family receptor
MHLAFDLIRPDGERRRRLRMPATPPQPRLLRLYIVHHIVHRRFFPQRLGQNFLVDNRGGGGGNLGAEIAVNAPADGYTQLLLRPPNMTNATLYERLNFNFMERFD